MNAELVFRIANLAVLPWWALWLVAPRSALAQRSAGHAAVFLVLATVYAVLLGLAFATQPPAGFGFDGLRAALGAPVGFVAGWVHYLVFDLFVGAWILRESRRIDVEPRPYLFLALMAGPLGLGSFLVRRLLRLRSLGQLGAPDLA